MEIWRLVEPVSGRAPCDAAWRSSVVLLDDGGVRVVLVDGNPLSRAGAAVPTALATPVLAMRSGAFEPESDDELGRAEAARRTWSGRDRFGDAWSVLVDEVRAVGARVWVHPRAGDVIGDVPALRWIAGGGVVDGIVLEPAALMTPSMLGQAESHVARMLDAFESSSVPRVTLLTNVSEGSAGWCRARLGEGVIDPAVLVDAARRTVGPVCVLDGDAERLTGRGVPRLVP